MPDHGEQGSSKRVKVRINATGSRYVGYVHVLPPKTRISDVLNDEGDFITLVDVDSVDPVAKEAQLIINKKQISYIQTLEEFSRNYTGIHTGSFVGVKIRTIDAAIEGEIFLPTHLMNQERAALLTLHRFFLNVKNAAVIGSREKYAFLAVAKAQIRSLEIKP